MAKIFRVYGYLVSPNSDELNGTKDDVVSELKAIQPTYPVWWNGLTVEEKDLKEWTDDHPLNKTDCPVLTCARYFEESDQYTALALEVRKIYESYIEAGFSEESAIRLTEPYVRVAFEKQAQGMYVVRKPRSELLKKMREKQEQLNKEED